MHLQLPRGTGHSLSRLLPGRHSALAAAALWYTYLAKDTEPFRPGATTTGGRIGRASTSSTSLLGLKSGRSGEAVGIVMIRAARSSHDLLTEANEPLNVHDVWGAVSARAAIRRRCCRCARRSLRQLVWLDLRLQRMQLQLVRPPVGQGGRRWVQLQRILRCAVAWRHSRMYSGVHPYKGNDANDISNGYSGIHGLLRYVFTWQPIAMATLHADRFCRCGDGSGGSGHTAPLAASPLQRNTRWLRRSRHRLECSLVPPPRHGPCGHKAGLRLRPSVTATGGWPGTGRQEVGRSQRWQCSGRRRSGGRVILSPGPLSGCTASCTSLPRVEFCSSIAHLAVRTAGRMGRWCGRSEDGDCTACGRL